MLWSEFARDGTGIVLFLVWLVLPPAYMLLIGFHFQRRWRRERRRLLDYLDEALAEVAAGRAPVTGQPPAVPQQFAPLPQPGTGRHARPVSGKNFEHRAGGVGPQHGGSLR
ncbi:hypothetical protein [Allokutzneria oryzae]|uniref:Cardiolipin synthase N-terminal domain-containing protein n=1 Tax=Allokutzneria oryzae TaxID=1378989 RepID=A0ABV6A7R9_9PSEU